METMQRGVASHRGISTIEIVVALAIGVVVITAATQVSFANQSSIISSSQSAYVGDVAQWILNNEIAVARTDFNLAFSTSSVGEYSQSVTAELLPDLVTKKITTTVASVFNPLRVTSYSSLITNLDNTDAPDTCDSTLAGDWANPQVAHFPIRTLLGTSSGAFTVSDVDVYKDVLYVAIESTNYKNDPALLIVDVSDPSLPTLIGSIDNASSTSGLSAIRVAEDRLSHKLYAYGANAGNFAKGQLQIFNITDPAHPGFPLTYKIPTAYVSAAGNGKSLYYKDGYVFIGLTTAPGINELAVIDVHNKAAPVWAGGYSAGATVESILVKGSRAYLATDDNARELIILDARNRALLHELGVFNAPGSINNGYGRSLAVVGDRAYLGRTWVLNNNIPEYYVLDISHPMPTNIASRDIGTSTNPLGVYGVLARSNLGFLLTKSNAGGQVQILDVSKPSFLASESLLSFVPLPTGYGGVSMDCERNTLFVASTNALGEGLISIITAH